jgi:hypothetical protein
MENYIAEISNKEASRIFKRTYLGKWKPWKPSEDEIFWHIDPFGNSVLDRWTGHSYHLTLYKLGNCYRTEADSTQSRDKWIDFYASDEVIEV